MRQNIFNLDLSRDYQVGFAKPLTGRRRRRISPRAISRSVRATSVLGDRAVVPGLDYEHHVGELHYAAGRIQCGHWRLQLPRPAGARRRARLSRHSGQQREPTQSRHSYAAYAELDTDPIRGPDDHARRPLRALSPTSATTWNGKFAASVGADPWLCAARIDLQRLPRAVAAPAILHHDVDEFHRRRAGRHLDGGGEQPGRAGAWLHAAEAGEIGQPDASVRPRTRCAA